MNLSPSLRITEVFHSLQGESRSVGLPTVFIRLTGCPLRCQYCDTEYAFAGGESVAIDRLLEQVEAFACRYVTVTGGEPLAQPDCLLLLEQLCQRNYQVSLETSGALSIEHVDKRVSIVLDLKTPGSNEASRNLESNISLLKNDDQLKFVICDRKDYEWTKAKIDQFDLRSRVSEILLSPSHQQLQPKQLAEWILQDKLNVRLQLQMHKFIWGNEAGH